MEAYYKKSHLRPDDRRKERISAVTGHRKDLKKNGAGSKTVWGKLGDNYADSYSVALDSRDPNFDDDEGAATLEVTHYAKE
mmetsp:Transcript_4367/g.11321  ORF Transcript_4367/g.11321 Transcript_4367/m.11321 type:complete len:81 (+) Transcript_4367:124-366(+)